MSLWKLPDCLCVRGSNQQGVVQHGHARCHAAVCVLRTLGPQQVADALVHQHVLTLPADTWRGDVSNGVWSTIGVVNYTIMLNGKWMCQMAFI